MPSAWRTAQEHQHFSRRRLHELKYGFDGELVQYGDKIWYSGLDGARALVFTTGGDNTYYSLFGCPQGAGFAVELIVRFVGSALLPDAIQATTRQYNTGLFYRRATRRSPFDVTGRALEMQRMQDYLGNTVLSNQRQHRTSVGVIFDPSKKAGPRSLPTTAATTNPSDEPGRPRVRGVGGLSSVGPRSAAPVRSSQAARC